jgi:hypothetical protein
MGLLVIFFVSIKSFGVGKFIIFYKCISLINLWYESMLVTILMVKVIIVIKIYEFVYAIYISYMEFTFCCFFIYILFNLRIFPGIIFNNF